MSNTTIQKPRRQQPSLLGPIVLIAIGIYFLLYNAGLVPSLNWWAALRYWPLLFVFIGLNIIVRQAPRPFAAILSLLTGLLVIRLAPIIIAVLLAVALSACSREETLIAVPDGAQIGELVGLEPCLYETGDVEYAAECGTLVVPENRSNPEARLIALPVMHIQATAVDPAEPVFWLAGGPGQSNMHFSHQQDLTALLKNHDFVLVGYRGVDGSVVLDCPEISQALKNPPGDLLSDTALASYGTAAAQCGTRLQSEGIDLEGYSMSETIDDMEDARRALGYERINLLGASYGTRLAMIYEWLYPDSLGRVGMIEVNTPGHFVWETEMIESQLEDYGQLCAEDAY